MTEMVVDRGGEQVRAAGAMPWHQDEVNEFRTACERSLFAFGVGVLGKYWLSEALHKWVCEWLQRVPPYRKLLMLPRLCCKTTIGSHVLPVHILIQPAEGNIYFPGLQGTECRILLAGEKETRATDHLRVIKAEFEGNRLMRALWPRIAWEKPRRDAKKWNDQEIILPRETEYPDPNIRATGVGGAITGARPNVIIKDDLISIEAANSDIVMQSAIEWHKASRALLDLYDEEANMQSLEFLLGCLTADSQVTMADCTRKAICDVDVGDEVHVPTDTGHAVTGKVKHVIPQGYAETWTVTTTIHSLKATGNHPFLVSVGSKELVWRRADQLVPGDLVVAQKSLFPWGMDKNNYDPEFCWMMGFLFGDGWVNTKPRRGYACFAAGVDEDLNQRVLSALERYVPGNKWYMNRRRTYRTDSVEAAKFLAGLGLVGNAKTKRLPEWVYRLAGERKISFLRGFCDADGGYQSHQSWSVEVSNKDLLEDLRHLACVCGVRVGKLRVRERVVQPPGSPNPIRFISYGSNFNFGTICRREMPNRNTSGGRNVGRDTNLSDSLRFERVVSVERNNVAEPVWDLTVEGGHAFFANGLAVHNTHWAAYDLYTHIEEEDPTVDIIKRSIYEIDPDDSQAKILWPERYNWAAIEDMKRTHGARFWLMYMNQPVNQDIVDFDLNAVRRFRWSELGKEIEFDPEARDSTIERQYALKEQGEDANYEGDGKPDLEVGGQKFYRYGAESHDRLFRGRPGRFFDQKYVSGGDGRLLRRR